MTGPLTLESQAIESSADEGASRLTLTWVLSTQTLAGASDSQEGSRSHGKCIVEVQQGIIHNVSHDVAWFLLSKKLSLLQNLRSQQMPFKVLRVNTDSSQSQGGLGSILEMEFLNNTGISVDTESVGYVCVHMDIITKQIEFA